MKRFVIDSQKLTSFARCEFKSFLSFEERLQSIEENSNFAKGKVVHLGMESYYKDLKDSIAFKERVDKAIETANTYAVTQTQLGEEDRITCIRTLNEYFTYRKDDPIIVLAVEEPFSKLLYSGMNLLRTDELEIYYEGLIDLVTEDVNSKERYVLDHKTTSRNFEPVDMRVQFIGYNWATGYTVIHNRVGFQTSLAPSQKFKRFPFRYEPRVIREWEHFAGTRALYYAYLLETGEKFRPNYSNCEGSFRPCEFINICRYPSLAEEEKKFNFKIGEPWDVFMEKNT